MRSAAVTEAAWCQVVTGPAATLTDWQQEAAGYLEQVTERYPRRRPAHRPSRGHRGSQRGQVHSRSGLPPQPAASPTRQLPVKLCPVVVPR